MRILKIDYEEIEYNLRTFMGDFIGVAFAQNTSTSTAINCKILQSFHVLYRTSVVINKEASTDFSINTVIFRNNVIMKIYA